MPKKTTEQIWHRVAGLEDLPEGRVMTVTLDEGTQEKSICLTHHEGRYDDVVLQEADEEPKRGKNFCMDLEAKVLEGVAEFGGYRVACVGFGDDTTFYQAVMEYTQKDGKEVRVDQCVVDKWRDGKIVSERFYHA